MSDTQHTIIDDVARHVVNNGSITRDGQTGSLGYFGLEPAHIEDFREYSEVKNDPPTFTYGEVTDPGGVTLTSHIEVRMKVENHRDCSSETVLLRYAGTTSEALAEIVREQVAGRRLWGPES